MSDERLLSEALRAHAAGGVSTPRTDAPSSPSGTPAPASGDQPEQPGGSRRRRFRPLGRSKRAETPPSGAAPTTPRPDQARPDVPAPRSGGPGVPPPAYPRGPMPPAPPTAPVRSGPSSTPFGAPGAPQRPYGPAPRPTAPPRPAPAGLAAPEGYAPWSAATVTWWSAVAVLAGGVVGGAIGVLSLLLPA
ncbi:hypothetical protein LQ327_05965 [Actinomycetospora endophytica]|uniref:Translation initiation factor IF-2 n=1 Tax=Actinomycetospora endophytica TaxID=2291215 RepID=A0ABS8P4A2_9PSEU|nr:hypothetical protein [Actinomycetospora endophytica]MCD2192934.1 hypothetical protein [Actinomycetospora endophytica]